MRKIKFIILLMFSVVSIYGQNREITGNVTDENQQPMIGVTIVVKGTTIGTVTSNDGNYALTIPTNARTLVFSFVGYATEEVEIGTSSVINLSMNPSAIDIGEVVAIGYGVMRKSDLTGSVVSIGSEDLGKSFNTTFEQGLRGRVAGVRMSSTEGAPGAGMEINIRGMTSLNADNSPLYVIDGFPLSGSTDKAFLGSSMTKVSPLASLNPNDIESIEILKDASATAIYGSRGANGVVLITTKRGKAGVSNISYNGRIGVSNPPPPIGVLDASGYIQRLTENPGWNWVLQGNFYQRDENNQLIVDDDGNNVLIDIDDYPHYNWQDIVFQQGISQDHQFSYTNGTDNSTTAASVGYFSQEGVIIESKYERYSGNINSEFQLSEKFKVGLNMNFGYSENRGIIGASGYNVVDAVLVNAVFFRPIFGYATQGGVPLEADRNGHISNPELSAKETDMTRTSLDFRGNFFIDYELLPGLFFRSTFGATTSTNKQRLWNPPHFNPGLQRNGIATLSQNLRMSWLSENILTYNKTINEKHVLNAVAGYTLQAENFENFLLAKEDFTIPTVQLDNIGIGLTYNNANSNKTDWSMMSYLARVNYSFDNRYLFTFSGRADGSSKFPEGAKWGYFPSGAFAWRFSEEGFLETFNAISDAKARISYGISGNQGIPPYSSLASYNVSKYPFSNQLSSGLSTGVKPNTLSASELTWETTAQLNIGLDFGLFNNRVYFVADYYKKLTKDLLMNAPLPDYLGFGSSYINAGSIENKGWEFTLNTVNILSNDFRWMTNFNISFNKNKVVSLAEGDYFDIQPQGRFRDGYRIEVGRPIGSMYGYVWDGVYQYEDFVEFDGLSLEESAALWSTKRPPYTRKEGVPIYSGQQNNIRPGYMKLKDLNGDGIVNSDDRTYIGNALPKHTGGIANDLDYKNLSLSFLFEWVYGNDILNGFIKEGTQGVPFTNQLDIWYDRWQPLEPSNVFQYTNYQYGPWDMNSFYIEDGSFLRFSNLSISYEFIDNQWLKSIGIQRLRISASGDNLYSWNNYKFGFDPDVSNTGGLTPGTDYGSYPRAKTYTVGLNVTF